MAKCVALAEAPDKPLSLRIPVTVVELLIFKLAEVSAPLAARVVNEPAAAVEPPIGVALIVAPSIVPPLISIVVTVPKFDHVPVNDPPPLAVNAPPIVRAPLHL